MRMKDERLSLPNSLFKAPVVMTFEVIFHHSDDVLHNDVLYLHETLVREI